MNKKEINPELLLDFEEIRNSMAVEGFIVRDETLERAMRSYVGSGFSETLANLKAKSIKEGSDFTTLVANEFGLKSFSDED